MNESELKKYRGKSLFQWMLPTRQFVKWSVSIVLLLCVLGFAIFQFWAHYHFAALFENETLYAEMKEFLNKKVEFPEEYLKDRPISNELKQVYAKIADAVDTQPAVKGAQESVQAARNAEERKKILERLNPYLQMGTDLARQIEKEIVKAPPGVPLAIQCKEADYRCSTLAYLLWSRGMNAISEKQYDGAFSDFIHSILLSVRCPLRDFQSYLTGLHAIQSYQMDVSATVASVSSSETLESGLQTLNNLAPILYQDVSNRVDELFYVSILRQYKSIDPNFKTVPGEKWGYYVDRMAKTTVLNYLRSKPFDLDVRLLNGMEVTDMEIAALLQPYIFSNSINDYIRFYYYSHNYLPFREIPVISDVKTQQTSIAAAFDRLRLQIATRLYELETGKKVTTTTDLVPAYFPNEIVDRETGNSYQWNANGELFATP